MEFRRITNLPPYVFTIINNLKTEARRAGVDVIDLGFGNPDIPSPEIAVEKLAEAARISRNHRYSMSKGLPKLREAVAALYQRKWGVELDPETEITNTIGSKEGFSHLTPQLLAEIQHFFEVYKALEPGKYSSTSGIGGRDDAWREICLLYTSDAADD